MVLYYMMILFIMNFYFIVLYCYWFYMYFFLYSLWNFMYLLEDIEFIFKIYMIFFKELEKCKFVIFVGQCDQIEGVMCVFQEIQGFG